MNTIQKPPKRDKTNPGHEVPSVPKAAKITMDIMDRGGKAITAALSGVGTNRPVPGIKEPSMMMWRPTSGSSEIPTENEAELLEHENQNRKFLPYANVHTLISETLNRSKDEWLHNHKKTRAAVAEAIGILGEQKERDITDDYTRAKYGLVKGFGDITKNNKALYAFEMWLIKKERQYERLSGAYPELRMLSFAPYGQVVDRCREMIPTSEIAREYYIMVGHTSGMAGASAEDSIEMEDGLTGKSYSTVGELEKLRFDVWLQTRVPLKEEDLLREREGALYRVGELLKTINENDAAHEARVERAYRMLERTDADNYDLEAIDEKRYALMTQQADALTAVAEEMAKVRAENSTLIDRINNMESTIVTLTAKVEGRDSETFTADDYTRETVVSAEFPVPHEVIEAEISDAIASALGEGVEDLTGDEVEPSVEKMLDSEVMDGIAALRAEATEKAEVTGDLARAALQAKADAAALVAAAEAVRKSEDVTGDILLEEIEELPAAPRKERGRLWKTVPGRVVDNIFVYGVAGKGDKMYPPKKENYAGDLEHARAGSDYNSWYGQTGRKIRKTLEGTRRNWKAVTAVATGVAVIAAATTGYFMYAPAQEKPEQRALSELNKPAVTQVAVVDDTAPEKATEVKKVEPKPEPLAKLALADVLAKYNLELEDGTNMARFYRDLNVEDVQEKYVILEEALRTDEQLQKYERKYSEKPILEMYADFLSTAMAYAELAGQTDAEKAGAKAVGERVAKRLESRVQQKRIKKKIGVEKASELRELAVQFTEFAAALPVVAEVEDPEETLVITPEQFEGMREAGDEPEIPVIILPDKTDEKPFDVEKEMGKVVKAEFESLDSPSSVNEFNRKAGKAEKLGEKFLMQAHLTDQIIEHGMETKMSEKRVLFMHIDTMNAAILFARADGQGMTAIAEALNAFDLANGEVKRFLGYKKIQKDLGKKGDAIEKNITWLRNRAEELKNKVDAYGRNKDVAVPLPGSPAVDNENGVPTAVPATVQLDRNNEYVAMQTVVFSKHGLSILEHPLKVRKQMRGMKLNSFDKFIILENLVDKVMNNSRWMEGLTKAEQFDMLKLLAKYLEATTRAANEPKNWPDGHKREDIMLNSLAIDVSDRIKELREKRKKDATPPKGSEHLYFPLDEGTFQVIGAAAKKFDEQLNYEYRQKQRLKGDDGE